MTRSPLHRSPITITILVILGISLASVTGLLAYNVVMGGGKLQQNANPAVLEGDIARRCEESQRWDEPKPGYDWIAQLQEVRGNTIRLLQGKFTDTSTTLDFLIEYPFEAGVPDHPARFRIWDIRRNVEGFASVSNARFSSTWGCGGRLLAVLEGLGPVSDAQQGFRIQIPKILKRIDPSPGTQSEGGWETIEGPWTFQVAPVESAGSGTSKTLNVNLSLEQGGITLRLDKAVLGADETVVYYDVVVKPPVRASHLTLAPVRIRYGGGAWVEGMGRAVPSREGEPGVLRFPALPPGAGTFEVDFRAFIASTDATLEFTLDLPTERGEFVHMDQEIQTAGGTFKAVSMSIKDTGFGITLEPVNDDARHTILHPGSSWEQAQATDNSGNIYKYDGGAWTVEESSATLGSRELSFQGELPPEAEELTLRFENFWKVQSGPWVFTVEIPAGELIP